MTRHRGKWVSYLRVSTQRQGDSGLGLAAQRKAVEDFLKGGNWQLVEEHVEVESGKDDRNRPALHRALDACKVYGATLVIAKIDRLSRDAHFLLGLQKAGVKFVAADMPEANEMVVGIMALVAQAERRMISERTKAALAAAKARGQKLGNPTGRPPRATAETRARGGATTAAHARAFAERLRPTLAGLADLSANAAAHELERRGIATAQGGRYFMNQLTFALALTMSDSMGRPIMISSPTEDGQWRIAGSPVSIVTQMPDVAPGATPVTFGDWQSAYAVVNRKAVTLQTDPYSAGFCTLFKVEARVGGSVTCPNAARLLRIR